MNSLVTQLNALSEPGDLIRLVLSKSSDDEIHFEVEGGGDRPAALLDRVSALIRSRRGFGAEFEKFPVNPGSEGEPATISYLRIQPKTRSLAARSSELGFGSTHAHVGGDRIAPPKVLIPCFHSTPLLQSIQSPLFLPLAERAVSRIEVDFIRWKLPETSKREVERSLDHWAGKSAPMKGDFPDLTEGFLGYWIQSGTGWEVKLRVGLEEAVTSPMLALAELAGRGFFGSPCKVRASGPRRRADRLEDRILDLGSRFPEGWVFPDVFPTHELFGTVHGRKKYHAVAPRLPRKGALIGRVEGAEVRLPDSTRDRHTYIAGSTGTGKSTLIKRLIREDLSEGRSVVLLDPHGDLFGEVLEAMPEERWEDLFVIDPKSSLKPPGFNFLSIPRDSLFRRRVEFLVGELLRFFHETWSTSDAFGPMFELYYRNALLLLILQDRIPTTVMDFERVFTDSDFRKRLLEVVEDPQVKRFWETVASKTSGEISLTNITPYITSKMNVLTHGGFLTEMMAQAEDEVRLEDRINKGCVLLVNLDKGLLGPHQSRLLGTLLTMQIFAAGLKRSTLPATARIPVNIYIDEFQNFLSDNVASMLSEARKFGLRLHLANQTLSQLSQRAGRENLLESVLGNVGNLILFRLGVPDAGRLESYCEPFSRQQMLELRNFHALARLLTDEGPLRPFIFETLP